MTRFLCWLFPSVYWAGRYDGWAAAEGLFFARIKELYPDTYEELSKIMQ